MPTPNRPNCMPSETMPASISSNLGARSPSLRMSLSPGLGATMAVIDRSQSNQSRLWAGRLAAEAKLYSSPSMPSATPV